MNETTSVDIFSKLEEIEKSSLIYKIIRRITKELLYSTEGGIGGNCHRLVLFERGPMGYCDRHCCESVGFCFSSNWEGNIEDGKMGTKNRFESN